MEASSSRRHPSYIVNRIAVVVVVVGATPSIITLRRSGGSQSVAETVSETKSNRKLKETTRENHYGLSTAVLLYAPARLAISIQV